MFSYGGASLTGKTRLMKHIDTFTESTDKNTLFVVHVGTNDLLDKNHTPQEITSKYKQLIHAVKSKSGSGRICVLGLLPVLSETLDETSQRKCLNNLLHNMANDENVLFLSSWKLFASDPDYKSLFTKKGLHLSQKGNALLTDLLSKFVKNFHFVPSTQFRP